jgi:histidine phosphotransferase ChpT
MGQTNLNLAALIGSRICHDLISPIGAISNGLELLEMAGGVQGPEKDLITDSVGNAKARIQFFRIAFGASGEQMMGRPEIVTVLEDVSRGGRHAFRWAPLEPQPRGMVRLAFLALQCCETAMPYGGAVRVVVEDDAWTVIGEADKLSVEESLWVGLSDMDKMAEITPALVQFALLPTVASDLGRRVKYSHSDRQVMIRF